jgi:hypothetical protein
MLDKISATHTRRQKAGPLESRSFAFALTLSRSFRVAERKVPGGKLPTILGDSNHGSPCGTLFPPLLWSGAIPLIRYSTAATARERE